MPEEEDLGTVTSFCRFTNTKLAQDLGYEIIQGENHPCRSPVQPLLVFAVLTLEQKESPC